MLFIAILLIIKKFNFKLKNIYKKRFVLINKGKTM